MSAPGGWRRSAWCRVASISVGELAADRRRPQGVAGQRRDAGCARAFAADVADHEHRAVLVVVEHVVEVAAHLVQLAGRPSRASGPRRRGSPPATPAAAPAAGCARSAFARCRAARSPRRCRRAGRAASASPRSASDRRRLELGGDERDRAERPCRRCQRHDDHSGRLDLAQQLQMRAVARVGGEGIRLDVRVDARLPAADHLGHPRRDRPASGGSRGRAFPPARSCAGRSDARPRVRSPRSRPARRPRTNRRSAGRPGARPLAASRCSPSRRRARGWPRP